MSETRDAEYARLHAYAQKRSAIVSTIWVTIGALVAAVIGGFNGLSDDTDLSQFLADPDRLGAWLLGGGMAGGAIAALFVFVPLYVFVLRKSDFGTGKAALIVFGAGVLAGLMAVIVATLPVRQLTLAAMVHREAARDDIRAYQARAASPELADPMLFTKAIGPLDSVRKAKVLQGLIAEQQGRQTQRQARMTAVFKRRGEGRQGIGDIAAAELAPRVSRDDDLIARYWSLQMDYFKQVEEDSEYLAARRTAWTLEGETLTFRDPAVMAEWKRRKARRDAAARAMDDSIAALNAPPPKHAAK